MNSAMWLLLALPEWYFRSLGHSPTDFLVSIPQWGILSLTVGLILTAVKRDKRLAIFLIPFAASEALVFVAGAMRGRLDGQAASIVAITFLIAQLLFAAYFIYRFRSIRVTASFLSVFSMSYAFFATFIASMSFVDDWI